MDHINPARDQLDRINWMLNTGSSMTPEERVVLVEVTKELLKERNGGSNHYTRKCLIHAANGNISHLRTTMKKLGINPTRLDAILPLLHG